ncbi:MAG: hypothetical protein LBS16_01070 [Prevotellaceae bacterium]|jgi:hypothetical protein|nr:hypothetical protein [Prevotellaceae bacterium]
MKKYRLFVAFGCCCVICSLLFVNYDKQAYFYGLDSNFHKKQLPFGISPFYVYEYPQEFVLINKIYKDGYSVAVGKGIRFYRSSFKINDFLSYGYNDTSIIVKCADSLQNIRYLSSYVTEYKNKDGSPVISFQDLDFADLQKISNNYQWYNVDNETIENIMAKKYRFLLLFILSAIAFFTSSVIWLIKKYC